MEGISSEDVDVIKKPDFIQLNKLAVEHSDGIIIASKDANQEVVDFAKGTGKPVLEVKDQDNYIQEYSDFYDMILGS